MQRPGGGGGGANAVAPPSMGKLIISKSCSFSPETKFTLVRQVTKQLTKHGVTTYRNGREQTSVGTETDRNRLQLISKRTSIGTRKGRVGYDRNFFVFVRVLRPSQQRGHVEPVS